MTAGSVIESTEKSRENTLVHTVTNYSAADEIMPMGSVIDSTEKALKSTKIHTLYQLNAIDEIIPAGSIIDSITHSDILKFIRRQIFISSSCKLLYSKGNLYF